MRILVTLLAITVLFGCNTPCGDPASLATKVSDAVVSNWDCKNKDLVKEDIDAWMASRNWCKADKNGAVKTGAISMLLCPFLSEALRGILVRQVPVERWGCDSDKLGKNASTGIQLLCEQLPW